MENEFEKMEIPELISMIPILKEALLPMILKKFPFVEIEDATNQLIISCDSISIFEIDCENKSEAQSLVYNFSEKFTNLVSLIEANMNRATFLYVAENLYEEGLVSEETYDIIKKHPSVIP